MESGPHIARSRPRPNLFEQVRITRRGGTVERYFA